MGNNSILDAFNAAAGFSNRAIEYFTEEKKYELDSIAYRQSIKGEELNKELIAEYIRIDDNGENIYQQNPEAYHRHVLERQREWRQQADAAGNGSRYYNDLINRIELRSNENMRQQYQSAKDETARQRAAVNYMKELAEIDNAGWDIQKTVADKMAAHERYLRLNTMNPAQAYQDKTSIINSGFDQALNIDIGNMNFEQYTNALHGNIQALREAAIPYLADGESINNFLSNKQERIDAARSIARKYIMDREYHVLDTLDNEWRRNTQDALRTRNNQRLLQAQADYFTGVQLRDAAIMSDDFDISYKAKFAGMFEIIPGLFGENENGGSKRTQIENILKNDMEGFIRSGIEGYFNSPNERITLYDAQKAFLGHSYKILTELYGYEGSMSDMRRDFDFVNNFLGEAIKAMKATGQYEGHLDALNIIKEYVERGYRENRRFNELYRDQKQTMLSHAEQRFWDIFYSSDISSVSGEELARQARAFVDTMVAAELDILRINPNTGRSNLLQSGWENDNTTFARAVYALSHPDAIWTDSLQRTRYNGIDEGSVNEVITAMKSRLAREMGVSVGAIISAGFATTESGWDEDGIVEFKIRSDMSKTYRFTAAQNGTRYEWTLEEKAQGADWMPISGQQVTRQQEQAARQRESDNARVFSNAMDMANMISLPMPPNYTSIRGDTSEQIAHRNVYIRANYDTYVDFLRTYYAERNQQMPDNLRRILERR